MKSFVSFPAVINIEENVEEFLLAIWHSNIVFLTIIQCSVIKYVL